MKAKRMNKNSKILNETDNALEWFPELKHFFENFQVERMKICFENSKKTFMIYNKEIRMESYKTGTGQKILVHDKEQCKGQYCCIHNPSNHHMVKWPTNWREDRCLMERIDPLGCGHPDPDSLNFKVKMGMNITIESTHGCTGLCNEKNYKIWLKEQQK